MNIYNAFYNGKSIEVEADSSYHAQLKAAEIFKAKKSYMVTIALVQLASGKEVIHIADL
jgi:hypothetical protein